jgi:hypothetical protein
MQYPQKAAICEPCSDFDTGAPRFTALALDVRGIPVPLHLAYAVFCGTFCLVVLSPPSGTVGMGD